MILSINTHILEWKWRPLTQKRKRKLVWCIRSSCQFFLFLACCHSLPQNSVKNNSSSVIDSNYTVFIHAVTINHKSIKDSKQPAGRTQKKIWMLLLIWSEDHHVLEYKFSCSLVVFELYVFKAINLYPCNVSFYMSPVLRLIVVDSPLVSKSSMTSVRSTSDSDRSLEVGQISPRGNGYFLKPL